MQEFIAHHAGDVIGSLSGFDRLVFRGTLRRLCSRGGLMSYLWAVQVLLKDFAEHAVSLTEQLKDASLALARRTGRPVQYLTSAASNKEEIARRIAAADRIEAGLICVLTAVEPCWSYEIVRYHANKRIEAEPRYRKCLHLYHYQIHPRFGFMSARIQTWLPFRIQICINGREWLARSMEAAGLHYLRRDNCFTWLEHPERVQRLMARQLHTDWPVLLNRIARRLNPRHAAMFAACPMEYYWSTYQSEWATDIMFGNAAALAHLYPRLVQHGLTTFLSPDVMRFLGRRAPSIGTIPPRLQAEVVSDVKQRPEGVRIKHRVGENSVKMYDNDKPCPRALDPGEGSVLRVETTINDVEDFKTFRAPEGQPDAQPSWQRMRKGVADLHRRAEVSQAANDRYLQALASVEDTTSLGELAARLCRTVHHRGRRVRAINPHAPDDGALIEAISHGEFTLNGLRNRDIRALLFPKSARSQAERKRQAAAVSRKLRLLRAHRLIRKLPNTHRYHLTKAGRIAVTALIAARNVSTQQLTKMAA
ncbi:MAG TPA: hypothetical protein VKI44_29325 [Acetobacteraceae bacterium]|nr:hypothetical protein [Acetobacteraceae bacterium]